MFSWIKNIVENIKDLNSSIDDYKKDTIIQSLPSYTFVNRAKKLLENEKYDEAEKILLEALELPQEDSLVYKYLGAVYEKMGKHELAVENYQKSADLDPNDKNIWQRLGFSLMSVQKYEQAEKSFENSNKIMANNTDTYTGWGMALLKQKKYSEACEKFKKATAINKYNFSALFLCAISEIKLEMYDKAEMKLKFLSSVAPNESNTYEYARLKAIKNDFDNAIFYAKKSLDFNPQMLPAYILLGQIYAEKYDEKNSIQSFILAEQIRSDDEKLYLEWGKALLKFGQYSEAKEKFLKTNTESSDLALCYVLNKEYDKAQEILEKIQEEDLTVKKALGILNYEHGEIESAIIQLRSDEEDALNCYYLAKCFEKLNNDTKTKDFYEAAIRINSNYIDAYTD